MKELNPNTPMKYLVIHVSINNAGYMRSLFLTRHPIKLTQNC